MLAGSVRVHKRVGGPASMEAHFFKSIISCMHIDHDQHLLCIDVYFKDQQETQS